MSRQMKATIFAILCSAFLATFLAGFVETRSFLGATVVTLQICGASIGIVLVFALFLWLGTKIFR